ncbi:MAG: EcsC family protein [Methylotetracoccus sp.]
MSALQPGLSPAEVSELRWAFEHLEHSSLAARLSSVVGIPIERSLKLLPERWHRAIRSGAGRSIEKAAEVAIASLELPALGLSESGHRALAATAGAVGGFAGPVGLIAELPLMTVLLLRSIATVARQHGEDLTRPEARFACVEVFGLGSRSRDDDGAETGYFGLRSSLALHFGGALTGARLSPKHLPGGPEILQAIASRFGGAVSDKVAARMIPAIGAVSGAVLNVAFMQHFQDVAKGHFIVRRLERRHGTAAIRLAYRKFSHTGDRADAEFSPLEGW